MHGPPSFVLTKRVSLPVDVGGRRYAQYVSEDELRRRLDALEHEHRLTRWYTGRVDRDLAEIAATQLDHTDRLERIERVQITQGGALSSIDAQLRSLTAMVGQVLDRLPEPEDGDGTDSNEGPAPK